ncbi:MAG: hypothetical protein IPL65_20835 [Lewinellaceae bacterium]|nr:hypothetical protein [Lewinellaceae bacterium]
MNTGPFIEMETGACRGYCPVYSLTFHHDGSVRYMGKRNVEKTGEIVFQLEKEELAVLEKNVAETNVWSYPERSNSMVADAPTTRMAVYKGEKTHTVYGNFERPQPLLDLEKQMQQLAIRHGIDVYKEVDPNAIKVEGRGEVMVLLRDEINAGNWIMQFSEIRLQLVRRAGTKNKWLVAYDTRQISEAQLLDLLKDMDGVLEVTPQR